MNVFDLPATAKAAIQSGYAFYFTGNPCSRGHFDRRYTKNGTCRTCLSGKAKIWMATHPSVKVRWDKEYRERNEERIRAQKKVAYSCQSAEQRNAKNRRWRDNNREKYRAYHRERNRRQLPLPTRPCPEACEICGATQARALNLDHCHDTNAFRGWICIRCNTGLARLGDNVEGLRKALAYLERAKQ